MADKKYTKLPVVNQTTTIKNFFDTTVEQLFSKSNIENISAYVGSKDFTVFDPKDTYILEDTADREKYSLEPVVNNINQQSGLSENNVFFEDFLNVLRSAGADSQNQNTLFDSNFYSFLPPINIDKIIGFNKIFFINFRNLTFFLVETSKKKVITDNKIIPSIKIILPTCVITDSLK